MSYKRWTNEDQDYLKKNYHCADRDVMTMCLDRVWLNIRAKAKKLRLRRLTIHDLTGRRFGRLTVVSQNDVRSKSGNVKWNCVCECGDTTVVAGRALLSGGTKSCGCLRSEVLESARNNLAGENNPNWRGGITSENEVIRKSKNYVDWRLSVFGRDKYACQKCNQRGGDLNAHHIEAFSKNPELRTSVGNGITLCVICHREYHHLYGFSGGASEMNEWVGGY